MAPIITLTTDFGLRDAYVGSMKGVILGVNPQATIVDISHQVSPQDIREGAYILGTSYHHFPKGTIHIAVVDPGVGTRRRGLLVSGLGYYFIGPDNGVFSHALADGYAQGGAADAPDSEPSDWRDRELPPGFVALALTEARYWRPQVSSTFHGRDIFAPVAAHLSLGVSIEKFGRPVSSAYSFPRPTPIRRADGTLAGEVIHIDGFGNLITSLRAENLPGGELEIEVAGHVVKGISHTYQDAKGLLAVIGSSGYLEVSERNGSAAARTGAAPRSSVIVRRLR